MTKLEKSSSLLQFPQQSAHAIEYENDLNTLAGAIESQIRCADEERWDRAIQWFTNASFLAGSHYDAWRYGGSSLSNDGEQFAKNPYSNLFIPKQVDNNILRAVEWNVSSLTSMQPTAQISPASDHPEDESDARVGELLVRVLWEEPLKIPSRLREMVRYLAICGTAAIELRKSQLRTPLQEEKMEIETETDEITGEEVQVEIGTGRQVWRWREGLSSKVWSAFHLNVNPDATDDRDSVTWIMISKYEDITQVRRDYNRAERGFITDNLRQIAMTEKGVDSPLYWWEEIKSLIDSPGATSVGHIRTRSTDDLSNKCLLTRVYTKPNLEHPRGRLIVFAGGVIIYNGPSDVWTEERPDRWHPLTLFHFWPQAGRFWGQPLLTPLVPLQKRVNAIDAILEWNRRHIGVGSLLIPDRCGIPEGYIGPLPTQHITYRSGPRGEKPERFPYQPLPADVYNERQLLIAAMDKIAGINTAPQLQNAPSAVRSNSMLEFYQRNAMTAKSAMLLDYQASIEDLSQDLLRLASRHLTDDDQLLRRLAAAAKGESIAAVERFRSHKSWDNVHIKIDLMSQMMQTPEAKKAAAVEFLQYAGASISPVERARVAMIMGLDELESTATPQYEAARRVTEQIIQGNMMFAEPLRVHDPQIFAEVIRELMLEERFLLASPGIKQALDDMLNYYEQQIQQRVQAMAQAAQQGGEQ